MVCGGGGEHVCWLCVAYVFKGVDLNVCEKIYFKLFGLVAWCEGIDSQNQ